MKFLVAFFSLVSLSALACPKFSSEYGNCVSNNPDKLRESKTIKIVQKGLKGKSIVSLMTGDIYAKSLIVGEETGIKVKSVKGDADTSCEDDTLRIELSKFYIPLGSIELRKDDKKLVVNYENLVNGIREEVVCDAL